MSVYRLEIFAPIAGAAPPAADVGRRQAEAAREEAWRDGYVAGEASATEAMLAEEGRLTSDLVEAIADARLSNEAARRHVASSLAPFVEAVVAALTPALAEVGLAGEVMRVVDRALARAPEAVPRIRCAPEVADRLGRLLGERGAVARFEPAPELLPREAQIFWDQGYDHLDLDACAAQIRACVAAHLGDSKGDDDDRRHG